MRELEVLVRAERLARTLRALTAGRGGRGAKGQALTDLRAIGDWLCSRGDEPRLLRRRPSSVERGLSRIATRIYRDRKFPSRRRILVRFHSMARSLGQSLHPNQILLHPELCADPWELTLALCHEVAHHTRGIEHQHDEVYELEFASLRVRYGAAIHRSIARSLGRG
jgi:hypothetical protein